MAANPPPYDVRFPGQLLVALRKCGAPVAVPSHLVNHGVALDRLDSQARAKSAASTQIVDHFGNRLGK
jgi:hypothetical protein